ncbi:kinase-like protein [Byssothecium circinans]|uniref:Kinase-like protein n=1 Tax=Byssothecium circinans TaxID=147558 RepID=A0A6A5UCS2_9PLEO|nr:kinase-like protein [Byssothecium circinans]
MPPTPVSRDERIIRGVAKTSHSASGAPRVTSNLDLCGCVKEALSRRFRLKVSYDGSAMWETTTGTDRIDKKDILSSLVRLSHFLQEGYTTSTSADDRYIRRGERRRLQCLLTMGMLYLYRSNWFKTIWDAEYIEFNRTALPTQFSKPYAFGSLASDGSTEGNSDSSSCDEEDMGTFMAKFGLLLLQIECRQRLRLNEEELDDECGIEMALDRYLKERAGEVEDPIANVLWNCLGFIKLVEQVEHPSITSEDMKERLVIMEEIFLPLKENLEINFGAIAAEIPGIIQGHWDPDPLLFKHQQEDGNDEWAALSPPDVPTPNLPPDLPKISDTTSIPNGEPKEIIIDHLQVVNAGVHVDVPEAPPHEVYSEDSAVPWKLITFLGNGLWTRVEEVEPTAQNPAVRGGLAGYVRKVVRNTGLPRDRAKRLASLEQEVRIMASLSHRHVVRLHATYTLKNDFAMIMSPKADATLRDYLELNPRPDQNSPVYHWFGCLASTFAYLHAQTRKIRHRDVKPTNILVKGSQIFVSDFGISKDMWDDLTSTSGPVDARSWMYCAPEVAAEDTRGRSSDIFSLGCVFLEMATNLLWKHGGSIAKLHGIIRVENRMAYHSSLDRVLWWIVTMHRSCSQTDPCPSSPAPRKKTPPFLE